MKKINCDIYNKRCFDTLASILVKQNTIAPISAQRNRKLKKNIRASSNLCIGFTMDVNFPLDIDII